MITLLLSYQIQINLKSNLFISTKSHRHMWLLHWRYDYMAGNTENTSIAAGYIASRGGRESLHKLHASVPNTKTFIHTLVTLLCYNPLIFSLFLFTFIQHIHFFVLFLTHTQYDVHAHRAGSPSVTTILAYTMPGGLHCLHAILLMHTCTNSL